MRIQVLKTTRVAGDTTEFSAENLSPIDASPLLLRTVNCPSLKFTYRLDLVTLHQATKQLLQEFPILAGRIKKASKQELSKHPYLKAAPYCIDVSATNAGILLCEGEADVAASDVVLHHALEQAFGLTPGNVVLPPWYQPLHICALLQGKEPLLKLQLTHCTDESSILAATMPHLLVDSHSSTLLLTRLSELYRQLQHVLPDRSLSTSPPPVATAAAKGVEEHLNVAPRAGSYTGSSRSMAGVTYKALRSSGSWLPVAAATAAAGETDAASQTGSFTGSVNGSQAGSVPGVAFERVSLHRQGSNRFTTAAAAPAGAPTAAAAASAAVVTASPVTAAAAAVMNIQRNPSAKQQLDKDGNATSKTWSKALLLPTSRRELAKPSVLKALSLDLQSVDKPGFGSMLSWLAAAFKEALAANRTYPGAASSLTTCLLSIPPSDLAQLKALASADNMGNAVYPISTNDAVSALVWVVFCDLRGRPLPGSCSSKRGDKPGSKAFNLFSCGSHTMPTNADAEAAEGGALGLAIDLRQNCADLKHLPGNYFGNAAWCLHILNHSHADASASKANGSKSIGPTTAATAGAGVELAARGVGGSRSYAAALQVAARSVRRGLTSFRQFKHVGNTLLQLVEAQQAAPTPVLVRNLSRLAVKVDAFITSWQFPAHQIDFGGGPAAEYCCVVRPTPPWQAAVLPSRPAVGGAQLLLTVPASAAQALKASPALKQLVPNAAFH